MYLEWNSLGLCKLYIYIRTNDFPFPKRIVEECEGTIHFCAKSCPAGICRSCTTNSSAIVSSASSGKFSNVGRSVELEVREEWFKSGGLRCEAYSFVFALSSITAEHTRKMNSLTGLRNGRGHSFASTFTPQNSLI